MLSNGNILACAFGYIAILFAIASFGDRAAEKGRSIISNPYIYSLSLAVYCTAWTFYGSVGKAARTGFAFLPVYLGPTLTMTLGWLLLRKIIRISKQNRITSIADFIASRYGKSSVLGGIVTVMAVLGVVPYISLQLKAISTSYALIAQPFEINLGRFLEDIPIFHDTAFYVALLLAVFSILFGTRHLETTERHEGIVAAIAFESLVKLTAFVAVGVFVVYGIYHGMGHVFGGTYLSETLRRRLTLPTSAGAYLGWTMYLVVSMTAVVFLPRQFQVTVVENVDESHLDKATWLFPLYLLVINFFVLPVALGGMLHFTAGGPDADTFVLSLPLAEHRQFLALFVFIGGLSAATGMVIVETVALSTMICNDLMMPILLRLPSPFLWRHRGPSTLLLAIRRGSIVLILLLGFAYFHFVARTQALVAIGMVSFTAVAQFAPAIIGGIFWHRATRVGALGGLAAGFSVWLYTLFVPSLAQAGLFSSHFITAGPAGIALLRPYHLLGLDIGMGPSDHVAHAICWSLLANIAFYVGGSLFSRPTALEHAQSVLFVDIFRDAAVIEQATLWRGKVSSQDLRTLLCRFLGEQRTTEVLRRYVREHQIAHINSIPADAAFVTHVENLLAGVVGSSSARVLVSTVAKEEPIGIQEVMEILDETRQAIAYSQRLQKLTVELKSANERLKGLDRMKDEFIATVTHELRTPLTAIRSIAEILNDNTELPPARRQEFSGIILKESERLSRLITEVLDFQKIEAGLMEWNMQKLDLGAVVADALNATYRLIQEHRIFLETAVPDSLPPIEGDRDRLIQVLVNLISNAVKFCDASGGRIAIRVAAGRNHMKIAVADNGIGIHPDDQRLIFERFRQAKDPNRGRPQGSGLGLAIVRSIVVRHGGHVRVDSEPGKGATFTVELPLTQASSDDSDKVCSA